MRRDRLSKPVKTELSGPSQAQGEIEQVLGRELHPLLKEGDPAAGGCGRESADGSQ